MRKHISKCLKRNLALGILNTFNNIEISHNQLGSLHYTAILLPITITFSYLIGRSSVWSTHYQINFCANGIYIRTTDTSTIIFCYNTQRNLKKCTKYKKGSIEPNKGRPNIRFSSPCASAE